MADYYSHHVDSFASFLANVNNEFDVAQFVEFLRELNVSERLIHLQLVKMYSAMISDPEFVESLSKGEFFHDFKP